MKADLQNPSEVLGSIAQWGVQTGVSVTLLILFVLFIRRPVAKYFGAHAAYSLWALPFVRLVLPNMTVPFLSQPAVQKSPSIEARYFEKAEVSRSTSGQINIVEPVAGMPSPHGSAFEPLVNAPLVNFTFIILAIWIGVASLWLGRQLYKLACFAKDMKRQSVLPSTALRIEIDRAIERVDLRQKPKIVLHKDISGPMVSGAVKPFILLPLDFETRFNREQQHYALVHEMMHIKRKDLWVAMATLVARALFWPNPVMHYAAHKLRSDQEASCDASVLARLGGNTARHNYAQTLIHAAKTTRQSQSSLPFGLALTEKETQTSDVNPCSIRRRTHDTEKDELAGFWNV